MTLLSPRRLTHILRRYGQPAELLRQPVLAVDLLLNALAPVTGADLPDQIIAAEGVLLLPAGTPPPEPGETLRQNGHHWALTTILPLGARSPHLYEIRAQRAVPYASLPAHSPVPLS